MRCFGGVVKKLSLDMLCPHLHIVPKLFGLFRTKNTALAPRVLQPKTGKPSLLQNPKKYRKCGNTVGVGAFAFCNQNHFSSCLIFFQKLHRKFEKSFELTDPKKVGNFVLQKIRHDFLKVSNMGLGFDVDQIPTEIKTEQCFC